MWGLWGNTSFLGPEKLRSSMQLICTSSVKLNFIKLKIKAQLKKDTLFHADCSSG